MLITRSLGAGRERVQAAGRGMGQAVAAAIFKTNMAEQDE